MVLEQVEVRGVEGELKEVAQKCITIRPNFSYSLQEVKEDTNRVFSSGYFERLEPTTEDTRDGVKLIFNVRSTIPLLGLSSYLSALARSPVIGMRDSLKSLLHTAAESPMNLRSLGCSEQYCLENQHHVHEGSRAACLNSDPQGSA